MSYVVYAVIAVVVLWPLLAGYLRRRSRTAEPAADV
ncbi:hypothetical protein FHU38_002879 [Saccharomonospora amisosensis]|uniref:Uncharacterized protein n=1 Tax=Saccharomonospora amisosensis TaxID=1128677 RepID=A0A7X5ZRM9_9PSEU|nr:hypothetical protein [Saccharomonospora amisosensis]